MSHSPLLRSSGARPFGPVKVKRQVEQSLEERQRLSGLDLSDIPMS